MPDEGRAELQGVPLTPCNASLMEERRTEEHIFIVRVRSEPGAAAPQWRATIEDVGTGRRVSSTDLRDVHDFIRLRIGSASPQSG
jgi:hypothetical protein